MGLANTAWPKTLKDNRNSSKSSIITNTNGDIRWIAPYTSAYMAIDIDGSIIIRISPTTVGALNPNDGSLLWSQEIGYGLASITIDSDRIAYIGDVKRTTPYSSWLRAFDLETKTLLWSYELNKTPMVDYLDYSILDGDDCVYFRGNSYGRLYCVYKNGTQKWFRSDATYSIWGDGFLALSPDKLTLYIGRRNYKMHAFNASDGSLKWTWDDPEEGYLDGGPTVDTDGTVFISTGMGWVYALVDNGTYASVKWSWSGGLGAYDCPSIGSDFIVLGFEDDWVRCFNKNNGVLLWSYYAGYSGNFGGPVIDANDIIYWASVFRKKMIVFDKLGNKLWDFAPTNNISFSPMVGSNNIYLPISGSLIAFKSGAAYKAHYWNKLTGQWIAGPVAEGDKITDQWKDAEAMYSDSGTWK